MLFLRKILLLLILSLAGQAGALAQVYDWARLAQVTDSSYVYNYGCVAAATDRAGNTYASQSFRDSIRVGTQTLRTNTQSTALIKYSATGQVLWVRRLDNIVVVDKGMVVDPVNGGIFVSAQLTNPAGAATWAGAPVTTSGAPAFYAKCSAAGVLQWANPLPIITEFADATIRLGSSLVADNLGNCYVLGRMHQPSTVAGTAVDTLGQFVLKTTAIGSQQWVRQFNHSYLLTPGGAPWHNLPPLQLAPRPGGGCVVAGRFRSALYFGTGTGASSGPPVLTTRSVDNFVGSLDAAGNLAWIQLGAVSPPLVYSVGTIQAIATDPVGNCYLTGSGFANGTGTFGLLKYSAAGVLQWTRQTNTPTVGSSYGFLVAADSLENVTVAAVTRGTLATPAVPDFVLGPLSVSSYIAVLHFNRLGQPLWVTSETYVPNLTAVEDMALLGVQTLGLDATGNIYYTSRITDETPGRHGAIRLGAQTVVGLGLVTTRIGTRHNLLTGRVYLDANSNGQRDPGESPPPFPLVLQAVQPNRTALSTSEDGGRFTVYADSGAYQLSAPSIPAHYTRTQPGSGAYAGRFASYGRTDSLKHFGLFPIPNQADLRVQLTPYGAARPGFLTRYRVTVENVGTTTIASGTATATLDSHATYVSSTPSGTRTGQTVAWTYPSMAPFARREFDLLFSLPTNATLGTQLTSTAAAPLPADVVPADNTASALQTVTGSFDPNDIDVNYSRLTPAQVAAGQPLDYTIRFQNMGTDTAFTVVVKDTLNFRKLALNTLQLVAQSHNCIWSLTGQGELTVRFLNIKLPHRNIDVIRSLGFVRFRVQPKTTLAVGEIIPNQASIVFDYNAPLRTNTATTTVLLPTATLASHNAPAWEAYPNPATDAVTVAADLATAGPVRIELLDMLGRPVRQQTLMAPAGPLRQALDLRGLAAGVYVLRLTPPTGPATSRQVVRN